VYPTLVGQVSGYVVTVDEKMPEEPEKKSDSLTGLWPDFIFK
jgi:hypothetical protein